MVEAFFSDGPDRAFPGLRSRGRVQLDRFVEGKTYAGLEGCGVCSQSREVWVDWHPEDSRFVAGGEDRVVWLYRIVGHGKGSGVPVDQPVAIVWTLRDRLIWRGQALLDHAKPSRPWGWRGRRCRWGEGGPASWQVSRPGNRARKRGEETGDRRRAAS